MYVANTNVNNKGYIHKVTLERITFNTHWNIRIDKQIIGHHIILLHLNNHKEIKGMNLLKYMEKWNIRSVKRYKEAKAHDYTNRCLKKAPQKSELFFHFIFEITYWWLSSRPWKFQCVRNGINAALLWRIDMKTHIHNQIAKYYTLNAWS